MRHALIIVVLLFAACSAKEERPAGLMDREKFTHVLTEAQLIEARLNHELIIDKRSDSPVKAYYGAMFKEQGVTEEEFDRTFDYYSERPEELKAIYEEVLIELSNRKEARQ